MKVPTEKPLPPLKPCCVWLHDCLFFARHTLLTLSPWNNVCLNVTTGASNVGRIATLYILNHGHMVLSTCAFDRECVKLHTVKYTDIIMVDFPPLFFTLVKLSPHFTFFFFAKETHTHLALLDQASEKQIRRQRYKWPRLMPEVGIEIQSSLKVKGLKLTKGCFSVCCVINKCVSFGMFLNLKSCQNSFCCKKRNLTSLI